MFDRLSKFLHEETEASVACSHASKSVRLYLTSFNHANVKLKNPALA